MRQHRLLVLTSLVLPLALLAAVLAASYRAELRAARMSVLQILDLVQEHATKTFETHRLVAAQAIELTRRLSDSEIRARAGQIHEQLRNIVGSLEQVQDIWVLDAQGRPLVTGMVHPLPEGMDLSDREYYRVHRDGQRTVFVSRLLRGRAMDVVFFQISWPRLREDGSFAGVVAVSVNPDYFDQFHRRVARERDFTIALLRDDGAILVRQPTPPVELVDQKVPSPAAREAVAADTLFVTHSALDQRERIVAYRRIPDLPIYAAASLSTASVWTHWRQSALGYVAIGLPACLALFGLSLMALRYTERESQALTRLKSEARRREAAEAALHHAQKMEAVGRLTGGIAHDFNNLLTVVIGNLDTLLRRLPEDDTRARRSASLAKEGALRAARLTRHLLAFSRQQPLEPTRVQVDRLVRTLSSLVRRTLGEKIQVEARAEEGVWPVDVDPNQLESALLNLAVNARDAMPDGGALLISAGNRTVTAADRGPGQPEPGDYVAIAVSDTGSGIPAELLEKVFEPFFTTKPHGHGTGLGLSQVYGFVTQSGGTVQLESRPGAGTVVTLWLPRARGEPASPTAPSPPPAESPPEVPRRVLVVEDQAEVRRFSAEALAELGFDVTEEGTAEEALARLGAGEDFDLLFSDVGLPGMDGRELARQACRLHPAMRVVLTSGHAALAGDGTEPDLLAKPFTIAELSAAIADVFASPPRNPPSAAPLAQATEATTMGDQDREEDRSRVEPRGPAAPARRPGQPGAQPDRFPGPEGNGHGPSTAGRHAGKERSRPD